MGKILTLGEIMLRLSTSESQRLESSDHLCCHYGGGEANVAVSLANFGHQVAFASKVPENSLGRAVFQHLNKYSVDTSFLLSGGTRLGVYYLEKGVGLRSSNVIYDRNPSSFSEMDHLEWSFDTLFKDIKLLHVSGITPALSRNWRKMMLQLVKEAKSRGILVSLDINYRGKLWSVEECGEFVREIANQIDFCSAAKLDALNFFQIPEQEQDNLALYYQKIIERYPNIQVLYSTNREVFNAQHNRLKGNLYINGQLYQSKIFDIQNIVDRVGAGDAYSGGILHGLLNQKQPQEIVNFATAGAVLKHTVQGDCNQFSEKEIEAFLATDSKEISR